MRAVGDRLTPHGLKELPHTPVSQGGAHGQAIQETADQIVGIGDVALAARDRGSEHDVFFVACPRERERKGTVDQRADGNVHRGGEAGTCLDVCRVDEVLERAEPVLVAWRATGRRADTSIAHRPE